MEANAVNYHEKEIIELKSDVKALEKDVIELKTQTAQHAEQISSINRILGSIEDNTRWIKRTITGAIISGLVAGAIALFYANF
ncbi:hemolysin XhlA family protein [Shouchella lehensis]|uniref:11.0 kDa protein in cwlL 5'region n=1 Tax=Shouchella lehensis G1 TaxID=1246626 RepID=A0A060M084_9BACI|nr:hemolysin XhlA family protein [Shouchella lehensis]AIC95430.1 11.0 kDa protein in cwlL 5'region [Shouchella lehensis G1]